MPVRRLVTALLLVLSAVAAQADQLAFGSFRSAENATNWSQKLATMFALQMQVSRVEQQHQNLSQHSLQSQQMYRVHTGELSEREFTALARRADIAGIRHWRLSVTSNANDDAASAPQRRQVTPERSVRLEPPSLLTLPPAQDGSESVAPSTAAASSLDVGIQTRIFAERGADGQQRVEGSTSFQYEYFHGWDNDTQSFTFAPFLRLDSADEERTHADIRELFYSRIGDNWDLHVGAKRVFWGVTEFSHLIDIVNQTDLVENIDTEDKLGQPMVQLSMVRDWGMLDLYALVGFRERTFPGTDGRVRLPFDILDDAHYESAAGRQRIDGAIRWSHYVGPVELGIHHFSGTSRDPMLLPENGPDATVVLRPYYPVIDQTGVDAQAFYGDWAFKLEGFTRSGFGDRYMAANIGLERTVVGVLGSRADLGLVAEYMFDERDEAATNALFEHDIALGGRLQVNDFADTQALLGVIFDTDNNDVFVSLEGSRRLSNSWLLSLEGRIFAGGERLTGTTALATLLEPEYKSVWLQDDDYLQLELKKFL